MTLNSTNFEREHLGVDGAGLAWLVMSRCFRARGYTLRFETEIICHPLGELRNGDPLLQLNVHDVWFEKFPSFIKGNFQIALCKIHCDKTTGNVKKRMASQRPFHALAT